jgi:hypothetical protein
MKRRAIAALGLVCVVGLAAGCGEDEAEPTGQATSSTPATTEPTAEDSSPEEKPEETPEETPEGTVIEVTVSGGEITPNGERVDAAAGEEIRFEITSDAPGELHVHTFPDQTLAYDAGTTTRTLTIDEPGVVEVEDHESGLVVVQLEVR